MPELRTRLRVFVASPGDTGEERERLARVVEELNRGIADELGLVLELVLWETHSRPGIGADPQAVINRQLPHPDIVIGTFWRRLGTPTGRAESGTAEELRRALTEWQLQGEIEVLVYFNRRPYSPARDELEQLTSLAQFRDYLERSGVFAWEYTGANEFESLVRQHLTGALRNRREAAPPPAPAPVAARRVDRATAWHEDLVHGALELELDAAKRADVDTLVAVVRAAMADREFRKPTADLVATSLLELVDNVARHSPRSTAAVAIELHTAFLRLISISVSDQGPGFSLGDALNRHYREITAGGREHGLLQVSRLATHLTTRTPFGDGPWTNVVVCDVYELGPRESVFLSYPSVIPVGIDFDMPETYWLGPAAHIGSDTLGAIRFAVENGSAPLRELLFRPLQQLDGDYLGIEITGDVSPSQTMWFRDDGRPARATSKPHVFLTALEQVLPTHFAERRVVVLRTGSGDVGFDFGGWAAAWDVPLFFAEAECRAYLDGLPAGRVP